MNKCVRRWIFPTSPTIPYASDWILLLLRFLVGGMMLVHGCQKLMDYNTLVTAFPDPIGLGSGLSFNLAILAEFACSLAVIFGFMFRLALIPLIITMIVATFFVMTPMGWAGMELPALFLALFVILFIAGPGRYSLDYFIK